MARVSPRAQPAKLPLTRQAVLGAGMRVLRAKGLEGVTMRAVAQELDTGAASLYVYVSNRQDLLNQMFDLVVGEIDIGEPVDPRRWRDQLEALLHAILAAMEAYPGIARVPLANVPTGVNATRVADHVIALLRAGGVDDRSIAWFVDAVFLFVNATAFEAAIYTEEGESEEGFGDRLVEAYGGLDHSEAPHFFSLLPLLVSGGGAARFQFGIRLMIEGLLHVEPPGV